MKGKTVRVSYDVPIEEHTFIKAYCVNSHISFAEVMRKAFHELYEQKKKENLHKQLAKGFQQSYEGKITRLTKEKLDHWEQMANES